MTLHIDLDWKSHPTRRRGLYTSHLQPDGFFKLEVLDKGYDFGPLYPFEKDGRIRSPYYDEECRRGDKRRAAIELDKDYAGAALKFFDQHVLKRLLNETAKEPLLRGRFSFDPETLDPSFAPAENGEFKLWIPLVKGRPPQDRAYSVGGDPANGLGAANAALCVLDKSTGEQVASFASPTVKPEIFGKLLISVCKFFKGTDAVGAWLCWETNGNVGGAVTGVVKAKHYGHVYRRKVKEELGDKWTKKIGWHSGDGDKGEILGSVNGGGLRAAMDQGRVIPRDAEFLKECNNFVNGPGGKVFHAKAKNSDDVGSQNEAHGDMVIAFACAYLGLPYKGKEVSVPDKEPTPYERELATPAGSVNWYLAQAEAAAAAHQVEEFVWS